MKVKINGNSITKSNHSLHYNEELKCFMAVVDVCKFSNKSKSFDIVKVAMDGEFVSMEFTYIGGDVITGNFMISALEDPKLNYFRFKAQSTGEIQYIKDKS